MEKKLVVVCGATGNQGGSVARRFLRDNRFRVRGLTRDPTSAAARALAAAGAEMVRVNLDDVDAAASARLAAVFRGAAVVFSVTQYWTPFGQASDRAAAAARGISVRRLAYDIEVRHGRAIADAAAATVDSLDPNGFLASTLSHASRCSAGRFADLYHYDAKADVFPDYVARAHPALAAKMSCIHTGYFFTSYAILPNSYFAKQDDGSVTMQFTTRPDVAQPHLDVQGDLGTFVYAVHQMPPGRAYMAAGTTCPWPAFLAAWSRATGVPARYEQVSHAAMVAAAGDEELGVETALMFSYSSDPGYDGGMALLTAHDLREAGIDCPMTTWEDWAAAHDWSGVLEGKGTSRPTAGGIGGGSGEGRCGIKAASDYGEGDEVKPRPTMGRAMR